MTDGNETDVGWGNGTADATTCKAANRLVDFRLACSLATDIGVACDATPTAFVDGARVVELLDDPKCDISWTTYRRRAELRAPVFMVLAALDCGRRPRSYAGKAKPNARRRRTETERSRRYVECMWSNAADDAVGLGVEDCEMVCPAGGDSSGGSRRAAAAWGVAVVAGVWGAA